MMVGCGGCEWRGQRKPGRSMLSPCPRCGGMTSATTLSRDKPGRGTGPPRRDLVAVCVHLSKEDHAALSAYGAPTAVASKLLSERIAHLRSAGLLAILNDAR